MQWLALFTALALPVFFGAACASVAIRSDTPGRISLIWGNGILVGLFTTALLLRLMDFLGLTFSILPVFAALGIMMCVLLVMRRFRGGGEFYAHPFPFPFPFPFPGSGALSPTEKLLIALFALLILTRLLSLGSELLWRPLFPWDATMHWATKARVWFDGGNMVPFVDNQQWLELAGKGVFTDHHADYPYTIPLLQAWIAAALGYWDESLVNLPWLLCLVGLGALFYGQGRAAGVQQGVALGFTYLLLSMPLLNTHVALAGYADLFLGTFYCAAVAAFYNWSRTRQTGQALLAMGFAACCPLLKNEGFFWLLTLLPGFLLVLFPLRRVLFALACIGAGSVALLPLPLDLEVVGHSLAGLELRFRPGMLAKIGKSVFVFDSWHLFGYLLLALVPMSLCLSREMQRKLLPVAVVLFCALLMFFCLYVGTRHSYGARHFSSLGRISLQLIPSLLFLVMLVYGALWRKELQQAAGRAASR